MRCYLQSGAQFRQAMMAALCFVGTALGSVAVAQTVSLDNVPPITLTSSSTVSAVRIDAQTGNVTVRTQVGNYNQCTAPAPTVPTITSFFPTSGSVSPGATITLNWSSTNTTHCTPQNGSGTIWASLGQLPSSGSQTLTAPASPTQITFQLTCTDGSSSDIETTNVSVQQSGGNCSPIYPNGTTSEWNSIFGSWPAFGARRRVQIPFNGYLAFRFTTSAVPGDFGSIHALTEIPGSGDGMGIMSISRDPGCFTPASLGQFCYTSPTFTPSIGWTNSQVGASCFVGLGQSWHVNLSFGATTSGNGSAPYCPITTCQVDLASTPQD